jgi:hypothetical protein
VKVTPVQWARIEFLTRVIEKECQYLTETDQRLFAQPLTADHLQSIQTDPVKAERLDAFVSRFGRLQDTLGDKLLPQLLDAMAERTGATLENLDRAEKLGWLESADTWLEVRKLRNQMVHEYIEDLNVLCSALNAGHEHVKIPLDTAHRFRTQCDRLSQ